RANECVRLLAVDAGLLDVLLSCETLDALIVAEPDELEDVGDDWMLRLLKLPFVQRIPAAQLQRLFLRLQRLEVPAGTVLIREGEPGEQFFLLLSGRCHVSRDEAGIQRTVGELAAGACFGEEALMGNGI